MASRTFQYQYKICKDDYVLGKKHYVGYGISVIDKTLEKEILCIKDITTSRAKMMKLIKKCNKLSLLPIHIYDIVDDFIG